MQVLTSRTSPVTCESCDLIPGHRGTRYNYEVHIVGDNEKVFPEITLCGRCLNNLATGLANLDIEP